MPYCPVEDLLGGYDRADLLRVDSLPQRLRLARLSTGITTLDYWVANARTREATTAAGLLRADLQA